MHQYDKSSKWLIQHHGDSVLWLAGVRNIESWQALPAEVVHPRKLPDGLLEIRFRGRTDLDLYLLEISAYPKAELTEQLARDALLVVLDRRQLPEVICLVLHSRGRSRIPRQIRLQSPQQNTRLTVSWKVIELWKVPAEPLLAIDEVGVVPWIPLMRFSGRPEPIFHRCREIIDGKAPAEEHDSLLAVTQILAGIRYNDRRLLNILGGRELMIESPVLREIVAEKYHKMLLKMLEARFKSVPTDVDAELRTIDDEENLMELVSCAVKCPDLEAFRAELEQFLKR